MDEFFRMNKEDFPNLKADDIKDIQRIDPVLFEQRVYDYRLRSLDHLIQQNWKRVKRLPVGDFVSLTVSSAFVSSSNEEMVIQRRIEEKLKSKYPEREYHYFQHCVSYDPVDVGDPYASGCSNHVMRKK